MRRWSRAALPVWVPLSALLLAMLPGAAHATPVIDGTLSAGEWTGYAIATGTDNVVPGSYELSSVYAHADSEALYMAFETVGASAGGAVLALNVGANRALTTSPTATLGENGAWSFAMELFNFTSGAFATADSKYKYNDAGVDYAGSPQSRDMPAADLVTQGQFTAAYSQVGDTQTIEYAIELDALETAFGRTYQDSVISVGDELPPFDLDVTPTVVVAGAIASRDFMPVHHDRDYAVAQHAPDIFMNILTTNGYVARFISDWAGPEAMLRNISIRLGAPAVPNKVLRFTGQVTGTNPEGDEGVVEVAIRAVNDFGDHATGTVTLTLPRP